MLGGGCDGALCRVCGTGGVAVGGWEGVVGGVVQIGGWWGVAGGTGT